MLFLHIDMRTDVLNVTNLVDSVDSVATVGSYTLFIADCAPKINASDIASVTRRT